AEMVEDDRQVRKDPENAFEQLHWLPAAVEPQLVPGARELDEERERIELLWIGLLAVAEPEQANALKPDRVAASHVRGNAGRTDADCREAAGKALEAVEEVFVVMGERDEHRVVDAGSFHVGDELLHRRLTLGRRQLVQVARKPVRNGGKDMDVRVDEGHAPST